MNDPSGALLADLTPGFRDTVHAAQQTFRVALTAMSRPGQVLRLAEATVAGMTPPPSLEVGMAAILLALLDAETTAVLHGRCASPAAEAYLRFHTGVRMADDVADAAFVATRGAAMDAAFRARVAAGSDEAPQDGATLIVEVDGLDADRTGPEVARLLLAGPGIEHETRLVVAGLPPAFWDWRVDQQRRLPRGIDLILTCGVQVAALPRSTRVVVEGGR